jgi:mono/diheme cytochrome c family protein
MKWISAAALAAMLLFACNKSEETTSETSSTTSETSGTASAMSTDTSSTIVPVSTDTSGTTVSTPSSATTDTTSTTSTAATGSTGSTGMTGVTGSTSSTQTENLGTPESMISSSDLVSDGQSVYKAKNCASCHGETGAGDTAVGKKNNIPDFRSAAVQKLSDAELSKILTEGKGQISKMAHKSKNLTELQTKSLVAWIRTLK